MTESIVIKGSCTISHIFSLEMRQRAGEHSRLCAAFLVPTEQVGSLIQMRDLEVIEVLVNDNIFFRGLLENIVVDKKGNDYYEGRIDVISSSWLLDMEKKNRSFQNVGMTYEEIIDGIVPFVSIENVNKEIGCPVLQFEETDWEFVKRMSSRLGLEIFPDCKSGKGIISVGLQGAVVRDKITVSDYNFGTDDKLKDNLLSADDVSQYTYYEFFSEKQYELGTEIDFNGYKGNVYDIKAELIRGRIVFTYRIGKKPLYTAKRIRNYDIVGRSITGTVLKTDRQTVKIHLDIDENQDEATAYPYVWAPDSGNIMYCMPQIGTKVALYFGDTDDVPATLVHCIRTNGDTCEAFSKPQVKSFITEANKGIVLGEDNININTNMDSSMEDMAGSKIELSDAMGINIDTDKAISISATGKVTFEGQEGISFNAPIDIAALVSNGLVTTGEMNGTYIPSIDSGIEIDNQVDVVAAGSLLQENRKHLKYPPINDEPEAFDEAEWRKNIMCGIIAVAVGTVLAIGAVALTVATAGIATYVITAVGAIALGGAMVYDSAKKDATSGTVSSRSSYIIKGGVGAFVGGVVAGISHGMGADGVMEELSFKHITFEGVFQRAALGTFCVTVQGVTGSALTADWDAPAKGSIVDDRQFLVDWLLTVGGCFIPNFKYSDYVIGGYTVLCDALGVDWDGNGTDDPPDLWLGKFITETTDDKEKAEGELVNVINSENKEEKYITRGAVLKCPYGSHTRRLNLLEDHGFRFENSDGDDVHPFISEVDCGEENIRYFGICNCSTPPDTETVYLVGQNGEGRITGKCCRPEIKQGKWQQTKEDATLADHNIVMQSSYLICNCGQCKIQIETDGWEYMD